MPRLAPVTREMLRSSTGLPLLGVNVSKMEPAGSYSKRVRLRSWPGRQIPARSPGLPSGRSGGLGGQVGAGPVLDALPVLADVGVAEGGEPVSDLPAVGAGGPGAVGDD